MKKIDVQALRQRITKTDEKWRISVKSFKNEHEFYSSADIQGLRDAGAHIPFPFCIKSERTDDTEFVSILKFSLSYS